MTTFIILGVLVLLIAIGVPIAVSLGLTAVGFYALQGDFRILAMLPQRMFSATTGFTLLAIPFFILAGTLMNTGGITERIFRFANASVGHVRGGLGQVNVLASLFFSGMSGAAVADAAGLGQVELKAMADKGYDPDFSAAITAASSTIGPVFPPSIPFVLYSSITGVSVAQLFLAGVVPGVLMALALMGAVWLVALRHKMPRADHIDWIEIWQSFKGAALSLLTPIIIIAGIFGGLFTPTEAGVAASAYAMFLSMVVYREIAPRDLPGIFWSTLQHTIRVMFVIAAAGFFGWLLVHQRVPDALVSSMIGFSDNPAVILIIVVAILLVLGMFLEGIAVIVLTVPLFLPVMQQIGVDPVQIGVIMIMCSMLGLLTPPVGMVLFAVASVARMPVGRLSRALVPYLIGLALVLVLVVAVPGVSTWLPNLVMGP
ncbi:TRAP transporter large permease [Sulfitobacter mediterraneus]|uniref:TRAP transporter large permease protein n=1 Tax=Sulfitobacter mediterraneus TaxID=83219 RepID=A0A2T6CJJ5_9RHOB|nr:TRAP transporter large permease [Sulfitobacter mediterraneus]KIN78656.1 TRAP dicarboxylate transporter, DctM subunit [Sulfitobacter mediterraneus KCTC 32188]PTX75682.1 tripartite ATP-independent transporter DctM subunit [Sulfitobacter mediterraneus]